MNYPELVGLEDGTVFIPTYDWKGYLKTYFKYLTAIKSNHHLRLTNKDYGVVYMKEYLESDEIAENLLKKIFFEKILREVATCVRVGVGMCFSIPEINQKINSKIKKRF